MSKEKEIFEGGNKLPIVEEFYTLQGEGFHTGKAAYFIRIGGCDIGCSWCDTKFSWNPDNHPLTHINSIVDNVLNSGADSVVVTGGEPTLYNLTPLCSLLKSKGIKTFLETSGAYEITGEWDWICLSPKVYNAPLEENFAKAHELKVIITHMDDLEWAEKNKQKVSNRCLLYLQPEWSRFELTIQDLVDYILRHTYWNMSIQAHKFMHIP